MVYRPTLRTTYIRVRVMITSSSAIFGKVAVPTHKIVEYTTSNVHSIISCLNVYSNNKYKDMSFDCNIKICL